MVQKCEINVDTTCSNPSTRLFIKFITEIGPKSDLMSNVLIIDDTY